MHDCYSFKHAWYIKKNYIYKKKSEMNGLKNILLGIRSIWIDMNIADISYYKKRKIL